jgi:hypothetical protein
VCVCVRATPDGVHLEVCRRCRVLWKRTLVEEGVGELKGLGRGQHHSHELWIPLKTIKKKAGRTTGSISVYLGR